MALLVFTDGTNARCIEVVTPTQAAFRQQFPDYASTRSMTRYNKFQGDKSELPGTWADANSVNGLYYSSSTGDVVAMQGTAHDGHFTFSAAGTYLYTFQGVSGWVGAQQVTTEDKKGTFQLSAWVLRLTDSKSQTDTYNASFEAVRGGRVLHLQHQKYTGQWFHLAKTK